MARAVHTKILATLVAAMVLAACEEGTFLQPTEPEAPVEGGPSAASVVERDVEAPDVFAANEAGLWDGRPSLGGVWVAHPEVADPERVLIKNEANGTSVVGALFRRERDNPGPRLQVSSDAAEALGLLAGQPSVLNVVALRREEVVTPAEAPEDVEEIIEEDVIAEEETEDSAEAETPEIAETVIESSVIEESPAEPVAEPDPVAAAEAAIAQATVDLAEAAMSGDDLPTEVNLVSTASAGPVDDVEAVTEADFEATGSAIDKPFIQIGIFNVEENAQNTAMSLRNVGVIPTVRAQEASGAPFWRVLVGPATSKGEQRTILAKVRELGFEDAYYVTN
ncbi:MAG: SPOR domain-containing protein [Pseudomonadota bacterium]